MLLLALALAAAAGVFSVFVTARWVMLRVMWTGVVTAVASGLTLPLARLLDRRRTRTAGAVGLAVLVATYALGVSLLWLERVLPSNLDEELGLTTLAIAVTGAGAFASLLLAAAPIGRWAGRLGVVVGIVALALCLVAVWAPLAGRPHFRLWTTGWEVIVMGGAAVFCLLGANVRHRWWWVVPGLLCCAAALVVQILFTWNVGGLDDDHLVPPTSAAFLLAFVNTVLLVRLRGGQRVLAWAVVGSATLTTIAINLAVFGGVNEAFFERAALAGAIVTGCGTMAVMLLAVFNRRADVESSEQMVLKLECPRCRQQQAQPVGRSVCGTCGLRFDLRVEQPCCATCGYLLWGVTADRCPECGTAIAGAPA